MGQIPRKQARRVAYLLQAFNLALEDWQSIYDYQGGCCAICKRPFGDKPIHTDHDHKTGIVRGLLCSQCNRALGKVEDPRWQWGYKELYNASLYLDNNPAKRALSGRVVRGFPGKIGTKRYRKWVKQKRATL